MVLSLPENLVYNTGSQKGAEDEKEKLLAACRFDGDFYFFQFRCFRQHVQHIRDYCEEIREIIWETAVNDIPALKQFCEEQLAEN